MKIKKFILISFLIYFTNVKAENYSLGKNFIPLKDFILLKYEMYIQQNLVNLIKGGGILNVKYQKLTYEVKIDEKDDIFINIDAIMDIKRYTSKKYFPKLKDCNQIRNKIFTNKYGYSLFSQKFNNLVNEEKLSNEINRKILNISTLDNKFKKKILDKTNVKINIFHPKVERNISCIGKITDPELK